MGNFKHHQIIFEDPGLFSSLYPTKEVENMEKFEIFRKKGLRFQKKSLRSHHTDTEIGPCFRFQIPKHGFGRTLLHLNAELNIYLAGLL